MPEDNGSNETTTVAEAVEFARDMAEKEMDEFEGEVPAHAPDLIARRATNLIGTANNIRMAEASEKVDDPSEEAVSDAIAEDAVDILLAIGTLAHEYDIDIADTLRRRMELVRDYRAFEEAMEDAESQDEIMDAMDEHMSEELEDMLGDQMGGLGGGLGGVQAGTNVDAEEYEHEDEGKGIQ